MRSKYRFRKQKGRIPEAARLLLMGHTKDRPEYDHLQPEDALKRALLISKGSEIE